MIDYKTKQIIAREGLLCLSVMVISGVLLWASNMLSGYTIFYYQCSLRGETQKIGVVEDFNPEPQLEQNLFEDFKKKAAQKPREITKNKPASARDVIFVPGVASMYVMKK